MNTWKHLLNAAAFFIGASALVCAQTPNPTPATAYNNYMLAHMNPSGIQTVIRLGFLKPGDAPQMAYNFTAGTSCAAADNGNEVSPNASLGIVGCWYAAWPSGYHDVTEWGADKTGASDSTAALTAAAATDANLRFPAGTFVFSTLQLTVPGQSIECDSNATTILAQNTVDSTNLLVLTAPNEHVRHCEFIPITRTGGFQVFFDTNCFQCSIEGYNIQYAYEGIDSIANDAWATDGEIRYFIGPQAYLFQGAPGQIAYQFTIDKASLDNVYPVFDPVPSDVVTWATNTAYTSGQVTLTNGNIYQETAASCTSAATGSGPSGLPTGTTPQSVFTGRISDGTCTWGFESASGNGITNNSWGFSLWLINVAIVDNYHCLVQVDNNNPGTFSYPSYTRAFNLECDHSYENSIVADNGTDLELYGTFSCCSLTGAGLLEGPSNTGGVQVQGGRFATNCNNGMTFLAGNFSVEGAEIASNGLCDPSSNVNISVAAGVNLFQILGNKVGVDPQTPAIKANYGVQVSTGSSDYYAIEDNLCQGQTTSTTCVSDGGSGSNKDVAHNY